MNTTDGDAERALEELNNAADECDDAIRGDESELILSANAVKIIRTALQSTRKPPDKCDGEPSTYWSTKQDFVHPVPVDTIAVPREVLQGALKEMKEYEVVAHAKTITDEDKNYWEGRRIGFVISQRIIEEHLASLDAVLSEGE